MEHPMRRRVVSEGAGLRPGLMGLGIDYFPVHDSPQQPSSRGDDFGIPPRSGTEGSHYYGSHKAATIKSDLGGRSKSSFTTTTTSKTSSNVSNAFSMRSHHGMQGLLDAELGGSMVQLDLYPVERGSGFKAGQQIGPHTVTPVMLPSAARMAPRQRSATISGATLSRNNTLFSQDASPSRNAAALKTLLGTSGRKASANAVVPPTLPTPASGSESSSSLGHRKSASTNDLQGALSLEKAKSKARVEVDIELETDTVVEGGYLRGKMQVVIRKPTKRESPIWIGGGKMRIVGFEGLPNSDVRYTFYQIAEILSNVTSASHHLFASAPDEEGFSRAQEGTHILPFAMKIPIGGTGGIPKGVIQTRSGIAIRYIAMGSIKLKEPGSPVRSIAHFYRNVEIYPFLGPQILAPSEQPLRTNTAQSLFMGGSGKVRLAVTLHRRVWVSGQRCYAHIAINNDTTKKVKTLTLILTRTMTTFQPKLELDTESARSPGSADVDACQTSTSKKEVATCTLDMGQKGEKGCVTAKGFWTGVPSGSVVELSHFILIPPDALSISRGRLIEVDYRLTVSASAGSLSSDISVSLPIRIINFLSIDPLPDFHSTTEQSRRLVLQLPRTQSTPDLSQRKSVSVESLKYHEEQLRRGDLNNGEQLMQWGLPNHTAMTHPRSTTSSGCSHPNQITRCMDASQTPLSPPHRSAQQLQCGHMEPCSPNRLTRISTPKSSSPTRSAMPRRGLSMGHNSPQSSERGRDSARDTFHPAITTMARSKTVAFADDYPQLTQVSVQREPAHRSAPPTQTSFNIPLSPTPHKPPKPRKGARLMQAVPMAEQTPPAMKLTASTAADDEMSEPGSDSGEAIYGRDEPLISAANRQHFRRKMDQVVEQRGSSNIDGTVMIAPLNPPFLGTLQEGDVNTDSDWGESQGDMHLPEDRSLDARDMAKAVIRKLGEDENLLLAELPIVENPTSQAPSSARSPPPMQWPQATERLSRSQRAIPAKSMTQKTHASPTAAALKQQSRARSVSPVKSSASYTGRLQSAFDGWTASRLSTPLALPHIVPSSSHSILGLPSSSPPQSIHSMQWRTTYSDSNWTPAHVSAPQSSVSRAASTPGFPFPRVMTPAGEEAGWSGAPITSKVATVSRAAVVMTNIPSNTSGAGSGFRSTHAQSERGMVATAALEHAPSRMLNQSKESATIFPTKISRPGHKGSFSTSSVSTESSLVTQSSTTSSSRGMPSSVKSKIAQLEARNRALKAVRGIPTDGEESDGLPIRKSHSAFTMFRGAQSELVTREHNDLDDQTLISNSVSSAYSDVFHGEMPTSMDRGFNSPMFRQMARQRRAG
ncbi:hypothetical protein FRB93_003114 [Tulasnella sp. JGI-2019a]|nr:hypothetical protein FRB93_003114 [Tulasnella sp. JGI-2019a]